MKLRRIIYKKRSYVVKKKRKNIKRRVHILLVLRKAIKSIVGRTVIRNGYLHVGGSKRKKKRAVKRRRLARRKGRPTYHKKGKKVDLLP